MRTLIGVITLSVALTAAGAVARQMFHLNDGPIIGWRCPACGSGNAGEPQFRFQAACRRCSFSMSWDDVVVVTGRSLDESPAAQ